MATRVSYFLGLDLGLAAEYTALATLERTLWCDHAVNRDHYWLYALRHLERFPLCTPYEEVLKHIVEVIRALPHLPAALVIDQTGVGRPVVDRFRRAGLRAEVRRVAITGGHEQTYHEGLYGVPKREVASVLQLLFQSRRLKIAEKLAFAEALCQELLAFRPRLRAASEENSVDWREGPHDDLVLAVGLAAWMAEREPAGCLHTKPYQVLYTPGFAFLGSGREYWS